MGMGDEASTRVQEGDGRSKRLGSKRGRGKWSNSEQEEGKLQRGRKVLASSRDPVSPGLPATEAEKPEEDLGPWATHQVQR